MTLAKNSPWQEKRGDQVVLEENQLDESLLEEHDQNEELLNVLSEDQLNEKK